ncbi:hypothetical protein nbrc107697_03500 [Gordonia crocea]|uniref:Glycine zipper family protein n=1 Tax=Gordonia crocea TaxID=589162 RepID=A0A7M3SUI7_9ACTN|nr:hypothetical protein nbrc107697_03500 [Gordonia crocea]
MNPESTAASTAAVNRARTAGLVVGLISAATAATLIVPSAAGASGIGSAAQNRGPAVTTNSPATAVPAAVLNGQRYVVVSTAPIGMAGPAAPAPVVIPVADRPTGNPKDGYLNEQDFASRSAADLAATQAGLGALWGAAAGAVIGGIGGMVVGMVVAGLLLPVFGAIVGAVVGGTIGAGIGAAIGAGIGGGVGGISGAATGYEDGMSEARWHNQRVRHHRDGSPAPRPAAAPAPASALATAKRVAADPARAITGLRQAGRRVNQMLAAASVR